jgi:hypothetical protein
MYYTSESRDDGFGAQFQNILWDILYYENNNKQYVFIKPEKIAHNYTNDPSHIDRLIKYMNIVDTYDVSKIANGNSIHITFNNKDTSYNEIQKHMDLYHSGHVFERFQTRFFLDKTSPYTPDKFHVAIHIRRYNQEDVGTWGTITPDTYYLKMINKIRTDYHDKDLLFHIYSQGDRSNFILFEANDTIFHLNEDILETFNGMLFADVLSTTTSSLSYVAALLSKGIIYHQPFWHKPLSKWILVEKD